MFNASTVMHHNVYVFYMSLLLFTFVNLRSLIIKLKVESHYAFAVDQRPVVQSIVSLMTSLRR